MQAHQATCVAINNRALLIEGSPGSGKSSLALSLLDRGAVLVGDDSLLLQAEDGRLFASPHPGTRGLLEVRGLGLLPYPVCEKVLVCLLIRLDKNAPRYVEAATPVSLAGATVPMLALCPGSPVLHLQAELALQQFGLLPAS